MRITKPKTILDANIVSCNVPENDYAIYSSIATYNLGDLVIVTGTDIHQIYMSVHAANIGNNPLSDNQSSPAHWSLQGATNKYKMLDSYVSSQTVYADSIQLTLQNLGQLNTVSLLNTNGKTATVTVTRTTDNAVIYNTTKSLISTAGRDSFWHWFFNPVLNRNNVTFSDIPPSYNSVVAMSIDNVGFNVKLGHVVVGNGVQFNRFTDAANNSVNYGASVRNRDYSVKTRLSTGDYYFKQGATAKDGNFTFQIPNSQYDLLITTIADIGSAPALFTATNIFDSTNIYGLLVDAEPVINYPGYSDVNLKIEGLI